MHYSVNTLIRLVLCLSGFPSHKLTSISGSNKVLTLSEPETGLVQLPRLKRAGRAIVWGIKLQGFFIHTTVPHVPCDRLLLAAGCNMILYSSRGKSTRYLRFTLIEQVFAWA